MRVLVLGDLHCRSIWKDIVAKEEYDKVVFLGDYTTPREVKVDNPTDVCKFLQDVLDFKDKNPDKVVLLRGNHCLGSLGYYWAECYPQDHPVVCMYYQKIKDQFLSNTQWVYHIPDTNIVCSHAGCSMPFLDNIWKERIISYLGSQVFYDWIIDNYINKMEPCELFGFTPCKLSDYTGESATQPCTWIRPWTLLDYGVKNIIHVVGHTPVEHISNLKEEALKQPDINLEVVNSYCDVWCCDCLANKEYLIINIDNGTPKFEPRVLE